MKIVTEVNTRAELDELKAVMEIYVVNQRIKQLVVSA